MDALIVEAAIAVLGLACLRWPQIVWYWKWKGLHKNREPDQFELTIGRLVGAVFIAFGLMSAWASINYILANMESF